MCFAKCCFELWMDANLLTICVPLNYKWVVRSVRMTFSGEMVFSEREHKQCFFYLLKSLLTRVLCEETQCPELVVWFSPHDLINRVHYKCFFQNTLANIPCTQHIFCSLLLGCPNSMPLCLLMAWRIFRPRSDPGSVVEHLAGENKEKLDFIYIFWWVEKLSYGCFCPFKSLKSNVVFSNTLFVLRALPTDHLFWSNGLVSIYVLMFLFNNRWDECFLSAQLSGPGVESREFSLHMTSTRPVVDW